MPELEGKTTMLLQVLTCDRADLSEDFVKYDTAYWKMDGLKYYELPQGKLIILLLLTEKFLWTTLRSWDQGKEKYYRSKVGKKIEIEFV